MKLLGTLTLLALVVLIKGASANSKYRRLINKIKSKLSPDVIPLGKNNEPVNVSMSITLIDITDVNSNTNQIEIETWLNYQWNSGISWSTKKFGFEQVRINEDYLWKPDMTSYNGYKRLENQAPPLAIISDNGGVLWMPKTRIDAKCHISPRLLALNETCEFKIGSWTSSSRQIYLQDPEGPNVDLSSFDKSSKYEILQAKMFKDITKYPCCPETYATYRMVLSFREKDQTD